MTLEEHFNLAWPPLSKTTTIDALLMTLGLEYVIGRPRGACSRGACERFNRTVKEQLEREVKARDELVTLDELKSSIEAWLVGQYRKDDNCETHQAPTKGGKTT